MVSVLNNLRNIGPQKHLVAELGAQLCPPFPLHTSGTSFLGLYYYSHFLGHPFMFRCVL